ncbi:MAG TPA: GAD-like domain-containing protein [Oculatellaceae cyanobacterium]
MIDQFYSMFIESFGLPTVGEAVNDQVLSRYVGVLPDSFLAFWKEFGWCAFKGGLLWTVNPDLFRGILSEWLHQVPELRDGEYIVFARSAFGTLYSFSPATGNVLRVQCARGLIMTQRNFHEPKEDKGLSLQTFFASTLPKDCDFVDEQGKGLFRQALNVIGQLDSSEVYGFEPLLVLGGAPSIAAIKKLRMDVHLSILRQFTNPMLSLV